MTNGKFVAYLTLKRLVYYLFRSDAGSLTYSSFSKDAYNVANLRLRRAWLVFTVSQICTSGGLGVKTLFVWKLWDIGRRAGAPS